MWNASVSPRRKSHQSEYFKLRSLYLHLHTFLILSQHLWQYFQSPGSYPFMGHPTECVLHEESQGHENLMSLQLWELLPGSTRVHCFCAFTVLQNISLCSCISSHLTGEAFKTTPTPKLLVPDPGIHQDPSKKHKARCVPTEVGKKSALYVVRGRLSLLL